MLEKFNNSKVEKLEDEYVEVVLEFMRHGEKENDPNKQNKDLLLTERGRGMAFNKGKEIEPNVNISVAFGSPKDRTKETAAHVMLSGEEEIDPNASLEEMREEIAKSLKVGKKIVEDKRLDFNVSGPINEELMAAFKGGKYVSFLVNESDRLAIEKGDNISTTYIRQAANIAEIVAKYSKIANNLYRVKSETDEDDDSADKLERYFATHQSICETFIAKCLEKVKGVEARDEFVENVGQGFKELDGMNITIKKGADEKNIEITYPMGDKKQTLLIDEELLVDIIKEREEYEKNFE